MARYECAKCAHGGEFKLCKMQHTTCRCVIAADDGSSVQIAQCPDCEGDQVAAVLRVRYELQCLTDDTGPPVSWRFCRCWAGMDAGPPRGMLT